MSRYVVFSISGFDKPVVGGRWAARTTWYVADDLRAGEILFRSDSEYEARNRRIQLSALDREYEKRLERALRAEA